MIQMEKKEAPISKELKSRIERICKFGGADIFLDQLSC